MKAKSDFANRPLSFWGNVRKLSEFVGYANKGQIIVPDLDKMQNAYQELGLSEIVLRTTSGHPTELGKDLIEYFKYRADVLNSQVCDLLMNAAEAKELHDCLKAELNPSCPLPMNKQKKKKRKPAYFTCIINMTIESTLKDIATTGQTLHCEYNPGSLPFFTDKEGILFTLSRRVDGAFPDLINPIAIWEIKEYYHTTTFGSRVADGIYETILDGFEMNTIRNSKHEGALHYMMVDAKDAWWKQGKSYLCRIIDLLNMGFIDEVLFGREVCSRLPVLVESWVTRAT